MLRIIPVLAVCALCVPCQTAAAQAVYKCTINGKVAYGDQPCAAGATVELAVPRAPAGSPAPDQQLARVQAASLALEKLRLARELHDEREQARRSRAAATRRQKCERLRLRQKWASEDLARTEGAKLEAARIKVRRQAESMAVECPV
jgi:hypothetical protein